MHLTVLVAGITLVFFSTGDRHLAFAQQKARPSPPQVTRVWTPITPAQIRTRVEPDWPSYAKQPKAGPSVLDVWIDEHGRVTHVESVRPIPLLDATAMAAVRQWTFIPAILHDKPVAVVQTVAVRVNER